jgi:spore coat polysaccharide biosynthesis protein SpsF
VLLDISGKPMLAWVVERTRKSRMIAETIVATTTEPADQLIADYCQASDYPIYRGRLHDVLDRYYQAARLFKAEAVVRITADCPLIDPGVVDDTINVFLDQPAGPEERIVISEGGDSYDRDPPFPFDFAANRLPPPWGRSFPIGLDVEVCTFRALEKAWREADQPHQREHVMPYLYERAGQFRFVQLHHIPDFGAFRWTVDTSEDLELIRLLFSRINNRTAFTWQDILKLFESDPSLTEINAHVQHKEFREIDSRHPSNS